MAKRKVIAEVTNYHIENSCLTAFEGEYSVDVVITEDNLSITIDRIAMLDVDAKRLECALAMLDAAREVAKRFSGEG